MNFPEKRWVVLDWQPQLQAQFQKEFHLSPLLSQLLINRHITSTDMARRFLSTTLSDLRHPFLMKDVQKASQRIIAALKAKETICIFGDYDVDGISGTALLTLFLNGLGARTFFYLPERLKEGYGLNLSALEKIRARGASLVITVDCGISDYEEVLFSRDQGLEVIITDHHEVPEKIPPAFAVVNPKQSNCDFPFKHFAGVGVVFYLIIGLRTLLREEGFWSDKSIPNLKDYLDLVALGTVADVVPLVEENRIFVRHGLEVLQKSQRPGITALKKLGGVGDDTPLDASIIGYRLAPRINAAGRMGRGDKGVILLTTGDPAEAEKIAQELNEENARRQQVEAGIFRDACRIIEENALWDQQKAFVLASPDWHPGVIGIGASRIVERYYRPTILISLDGDTGRGSARSIEAFHIHDGLKQCQEFLEAFGGHEFAAGLTVTRENVNPLRERLNLLAGNLLSPEDLIPKLYIDARVDLGQVSESLVEEIQCLAPFGNDNPEPLFVSGEISAAFPRIVGNGHLKMRVGDGENDFDAIGFGLGSALPDPSSSLRLVFRPEINVWQGTKRLQIKMKDLQVV